MSEKKFSGYKTTKTIFLFWFQRKIYDEKLLAFIESLLPELTRKAQNYSLLGKKGLILILIYLNIYLILI